MSEIIEWFEENLIHSKYISTCRYKILLPREYKKGMMSSIDVEFYNLGKLMVEFIFEDLEKKVLFDLTWM